MKLKLLALMLASTVGSVPAQATDLAAVQRVISDPSSAAAPGCAVGAFRNGETLFVTAAGLGDIGNSRPLDGDTLFYAASVSKQFTALAAAKLIEQGRLGLGEDIRKYLPELPEYAVPVTVQMLMHHTAGIRDSLDLLRLAGVDSAAKADKETVLQLLFRQQSTNFTPGTRYTYSNGGYLLLAEIVERVSGMPFADFAKNSILQPLGMDRSMFMHGARPNAKNVAHGYVPVGDGFEIRDTYPRFSGSGGLMVSINDLAKFDRDIQVGHEIWTPALAKLMLTPGTFSNGDPAIDPRANLVYGGGLMIGQRSGVNWVQHGGEAEAFKNMYARLPDRGLGVAVLCNRGDWVSQDKADAIIELIEGDILQDAPSPAATADLGGRYVSDEIDAVYEVSVSGDTLTAAIASRLPGAAGSSLQFERNDDGSYQAQGIRLVADPDGQGFTLETERVHAVHLRRADQSNSADLVIRGGTIYDGSSLRPIVGDVAVSEDKIVYVGASANNPYQGKREIDARGMIVAPGFIDPHTHAEVFLTATSQPDRLNLPWMMQGVTTIFTGVDGGGSTDIAGFFGRLERDKFGVNAAAYVGFGAVRRAVLGDDARMPTADELESMQDIVATGMCEGALGFSTGLFYAPQSFAKTQEVIEIAKQAAKRGGVYDTHQRDESSYTVGVVASTQEAIEIGRAAGMPVHIAHFKALGVDVHGKAPELIATINAARAAGQDVTVDQYPWAASGSALEAALLPRWSVDGGRKAMLGRFDDPAQLEKIQAEMRENLRRRGGPDSLLLTAPNLPWTGKRLGAIAKEWNIEPIQAAVRIIRETERGTAVVSFNMAESDIKLLMQQSWTMTSSDGSLGHPRMYATFPQKYAKYVLAEKTITLPEFINSSTGRTADRFKLDRRGHLRSGYFADVVVFDPTRYRPKADYVNPAVLAEGIQTLLVNGVVAVDGGKPTGIAAGRGIKHVPTPEACSE